MYGRLGVPTGVYREGEAYTTRIQGGIYHPGYREGIYHQGTGRPLPSPTVKRVKERPLPSPTVKREGKGGTGRH